MDRVAVGACPVCSSTEAAPLYAAVASHVDGAHAGGTRWSLWRCASCGAARLDPRPADDELGALYDVYFTKSPPPVEAEVRGAARARRAIRNGYLNDVLGYSLRPAVPFGLSRLLLRPFPVKRAVLERSVRLPFRAVTNPGRLLDVGCGNGSFVLYAAATGWDAVGIDVDAAAVAYASAAGADARCETPEDHARRHAGHYDAVTLSHVVEHVGDPVALLRSSRDLLRPGGTAWIATPNLDADGHRRYGGRWVGLDVPRHLVLFDEPALREALRRAGFVDIHRVPSAGFTLHGFAVSEGRRDRNDPPERHGPVPWAVRVTAAVSERRSVARPQRGEELVMTARRPGDERPAPLRILQVPPRYAPHIGGVEAVARELAVGLARRGHAVHVACADEPAGGPTVVDGVPVTRLAFAGKVANTNITLGLPWHLLRADFDVAHTHLPTPWSADWTCLVARLRRRPAVLTYNNRIAGTGGGAVVARAYERLLLPVTLRLATAVVVSSEPWKDELVRRFPWLAPKLAVIANGVDTGRFSPDAVTPGENGLLFVGVLDPFHEYKGLHVLLEALRSCPGVRLKVVGDGADRSRYENRAGLIGLGDRVVFLGAVDDAELARRYKQAALFVLPSRLADREGGSSLVVLEALASGLPAVVSTGAGEIADLVATERLGVKVPAGDPAALADAIRALLSDGEERGQMGRRARAWAEAHASWDAVVGQVEELYRGCVAERSTSGRRRPGRA